MAKRTSKGVDDLIVQHGAEAFHRAYRQALSLSTWLVQTSVQLTYKASIQVNRRYLGSLTKAEVRLEDEEAGRQGGWETAKTSPSPLHIPDTAKLICLKSPKGTGKTHLLEQIVSRAISEGKWVLLLTHRIQLGEALCQIDYIRGLTGFHVEPFVVVNDWQPPIEQRWTVHNYEVDNSPA